MEHSQLHTENTSLLSELSAVSEKLKTVQKCYRQAEQENMHLAEELREMERERDKLYEDKMKLQVYTVKLTSTQSMLEAVLTNDNLFACYVCAHTSLPNSLSFSQLL